MEKKNKTTLQELAEFIYKKVYFESGGKGDYPQPFPLQTAQFVYKFGCQAPFLKIVKSWNSKEISFRTKINLLYNFLHRIYQIKYDNYTYNELLQRNSVINDIHSNIRKMKVRKKRSARNYRTHIMLSKTGLGEYYDTMNKIGQFYQT